MRTYPASAYIADTAGNTLLPHVAVDEAAPELAYDLCIAYACDPAENDGEPTHVDCDDAIRTTRDGNPACCRLGQRAPAAVGIDTHCTIGGLRNDSGTAIVYLEATEGTQCGPPLRIALTGGED